MKKAKPKSKWEIAKAEKFEREALALLTTEQRPKFDEDEALIRRDKETQNALRQEGRAAKKRKRDAVEEAKIRLVEKKAKDKREAYERSKHRRVNPPAGQGNSVAPVTVPFVTPIGDPVLRGDYFHNLWTAITTRTFPIPGTARDPVTSDILAVLAKHQNQAQTPQPSASTSQAKVAKTPRRQPAAGKRKAEASKEVQAQILNPPVLLSPISPKPTKGKVIARPKTVAKDAHTAKSTPAKELKLILKRFDDENPGVTLVILPKARRKSAINPPSKELVEVAGKQAARRNSLRSAKDPDPGKGNTPGTEHVNLKGKSKGLFDTDSAEEELLKETPIPTEAPTQAPTPAEKQTAAATTELPGPISRRSRRLVDSSSESEHELIVTAEEEEEEDLKNAALSSIKQDKAVDTLEEAAKKLDFVCLFIIRLNDEL